MRDNKAAVLEMISNSHFPRGFFREKKKEQISNFIKKKKELNFKKRRRRTKFYFVCVFFVDFSFAAAGQDNRRDGQ